MVVPLIPWCDIRSLLSGCISYDMRHIYCTAYSVTDCFLLLTTLEEVFGMPILFCRCLSETFFF